jgi:hypothetical protein
MYFYFLLTPWVYVGISTKIFGLGSKKRRIFCTSEVLTNYQTPRLGIQPRTCGNLVDRSWLIYHYARSAREILRFPNLYQLWFFSKNSRRYDKTQESGVGRWLIYQPLAGFLLTYSNKEFFIVAHIKTLWNNTWMVRKMKNWHTCYHQHLILSKSITTIPKVIYF